ncbi:tRNA (cytidine/uridine-2'-O-)-methyltransferase [Endozoicomonas montiporae]|uniref:tRNA (cytidine/uridine-2'-O-)-methyltransferase TrmJ n=2 Tax=Endozoicomonas montiporae TaxID=1027273 RepID=A0A081NAB2_9GAMM|nr:tRNA (cytosine(32)/uridine(32)-2'-O)-methyltransferase TrmJ [Endozoicomonas montiporae]AMO56933.1 RNA methyltransferase TrmH [Endozoicomonas montiporae CL-33]KEQ15385.1 tRNA (cytidine/uridine-2'-O-)-methyltransferase [Endozoicomonas montiporae]
MLSTIRIILINTFHPGNIGSAARAMKTMGLSDLCLVTPQRYPDAEADAMAAGAMDVLENARVFASLDDAIADCSLVIGTSARSRNSASNRPMLEAEACAEALLKESMNQPVALVFGQETMGLTNEELEKCHFHTCIDANPDYPVLNVASAIQILCYELRKASVRFEQANIQPKQAHYPLQEELERFYLHLEQTLTDIDFIIQQHPGKVMKRLRRLFNRARPESKELNMLRGILSSAQKASVAKDSTND